MMNKIIFIRHGKTKGNNEKRYIGKTDESLSKSGQKEIQQNLQNEIYPCADIVGISPMKRCYETAQIIYANQDYQVIEKFRECDFGDFENRNYQELQGNPDYQAWIDSNGSMAFPNGEVLEAFKCRCLEGFIDLMNEIEKKDIETIALVIHGGTIMAIMSKLCKIEKSYYDWMTRNGNGYICGWNGKQLEYVQALK